MMSPGKTLLQSGRKVQACRRTAVEMSMPKRARDQGRSYPDKILG